MSNKIRFWNEYSEVAKKFPIVPAKKAIPSWLKTLQAKVLPEIGLEEKYNVTLKKCPGIVNFSTTGFILSTWSDICIETDFRTGKTLITHPFNKNAEIKNIHMQSEAMFPELWGDNPPMQGDIFPTVLKIKTGWFVQLPKNIDMLFLPVTYQFHPDFTACPGILDTRHVEGLFTQIFWHPTNKKVIIPAGTPLVQLIPIEHNPEYNFEVITDEDSIKNIHLGRNNEKVDRIFSQQRSWINNPNNPYLQDPGPNKYSVFNEKFFDSSIDDKWDEKETQCPFHKKTDET